MELQLSSQFAYRVLSGRGTAQFRAVELYIPIATYVKTTLPCRNICCSTFVHLLRGSALRRRFTKMTEPDGLNCFRI
jgi:hypothetical protein